MKQTLRQPPPTLSRRHPFKYFEPLGRHFAGLERVKGVMDSLHIISAIIVFGTGIGIANFMFLGHSVAIVRTFATRMTVRADFLFILPAVIVQPLSGAWLIFYAGLAGTTIGWC